MYVDCQKPSMNKFNLKKVYSVCYFQKTSPQSFALIWKLFNISMLITLYAP